MNDAQLIIEIINQRGYLVVGSPRPMAKGSVVPASHLRANHPHRGDLAKMDTSVNEAHLLYVVTLTDKSDMREQDLFVARLCGVEAPRGTADHKFFYRVQAD